MVELFQRIGPWPIMGEQWKQDEFDLTKLAIESTKMEFFIFFLTGVVPLNATRSMAGVRKKHPFFKL